MIGLQPDTGATQQSLLCWRQAKALRNVTSKLSLIDDPQATATYKVLIFIKIVVIQRLVSRVHLLVSAKRSREAKLLPR